ncbi:MAG: alpha/beta hydrolase, partial [Candidatus Binataceae bacterium]
PLALIELSAIVRSRLGKIMQPVLIIQSRRDHVCPYRKNVGFLMTHLGSVDKRAVTLEESFHVITVDSEKERVVAEIAGFIAPMRAAYPPLQNPAVSQAKTENRVI